MSPRTAHTCTMSQSLAHKSHTHPKNLPLHILNQSHKSYNHQMTPLLHMHPVPPGTPFSPSRSAHRRNLRPPNQDSPLKRKLLLKKLETPEKIGRLNLEAKLQERNSKKTWPPLQKMVPPHYRTGPPPQRKLRKLKMYSARKTKITPKKKENFHQTIVPFPAPNKI